MQVPLNIKEITTQIRQHRFGIVSSDSKIKLESTKGFHNILSIENNPPIQQVIDTDVVPILVNFLQNKQNPSLQYEAACVLTSITSGTSDQTRVVIDNGAIPIFIHLLKSTNEDVCQESVWALGNIAGDSVEFRDIVLQNGALDVLLQVSQQSFNKSTKLSMIRQITWTISNLCRDKPNFELVRPALPLLAKLLFSKDTDVVADACWALSYLSDGTKEQISTVLATGIASRLIELLGNEDASVQAPALRTVGNIVTGDIEQIQVIIDLNALPALLNLLENPFKNIHKEACFIISNITAGTQDQIQAVIDANIVPKLIDLLNSSELDIQKLSVCTISNIAEHGLIQQVLTLLQMGIIPPLISLLHAQDNELIKVVLDSLQNILRFTSGSSDIAAKQQVKHIINEFCNGKHCINIKYIINIKAIEDLQNHKDKEIYNRAIQLVELFNDIIYKEAVEEEKNSDNEELSSIKNNNINKEFSYLSL
jgi:HEAT repeat protein